MRYVCRFPYSLRENSRGMVRPVVLRPFLNCDAKVVKKSETTKENMLIKVIIETFNLISLHR